jgi:hypothetical protein
VRPFQIAGCALALPATIAVLAVVSGPVAAQEPDPNPTSTATPTATATPDVLPATTPVPTPTVVATPMPTPTPESGGWPVVHKVLAKQRFTIGRVRSSVLITLDNGKLTLKVSCRGRHLSAVRRLSIKGKLIWRTVREPAPTGFKLHPVRRFSGRDKLDAGKRKVKWTYSKSWSIPLPVVAEVWQLRLSARFNGSKITGIDPLPVPFPLLVPATVLEPS